MKNWEGGHKGGTNNRTKLRINTPRNNIRKPQMALKLPRNFQIPQTAWFSKTAITLPDSWSNWNLEVLYFYRFYFTSLLLVSRLGILHSSHTWSTDVCLIHICLISFSFFKRSSWLASNRDTFCVRPLNNWPCILYSCLTFYAVVI